MVSGTYTYLHPSNAYGKSEIKREHNVKVQNYLLQYQQNICRTGLSGIIFIQYLFHSYGLIHQLVLVRFLAN